MERSLVSISIHAQHGESEFHPSVRGFNATGREVICLDLTDMFTSIFLNRERLHQLRDVLVEACERYPVQETDPRDHPAQNNDDSFNPEVDAA